MEDKLIIKYIKRKNEHGLEILVDKYGGFITAVIRHCLFEGNNHEEECMDDVLLALWNNIDKFHPEKNSFKNWIGSVAKYKAIDYNRKFMRRQCEESTHELFDFPDDTRVEDTLLQQELRDDLDNLLNNLKPKDKKLFISYYLEDKKVEALAKETGMKTHTIYNRLSRGRAKLKSIFGNTTIT